MSLCECGCGQPTKPAPQTHRAKGWVKGEPMRFLHGHRQMHIHFRSGVDWIEEDRGYVSCCWIWQHGLDRAGYGKVKRDGRSHRAHRYIYEMTHQTAIPPWLVADHLCRVPSCVRPDHLDIVSVAENTRRGAVAKLTPEVVSAIRSRLANGAHADDLASEYGVWRHTIRNCARGHTWV